ncbi:MAG: HD domain-containing protein [Clostridia bacterium]|nr:HD domain-containing protein [Clostridia bacterium]
MIHNSQMTEAWTGKDFFKTIFNFFIHAVIIMLLFVGAVLINEGSIEKLLAFFATQKTCMNFLYCGLALFFLLAMLYLYFYYEFRDFLKKISNIYLLFFVLECSIIISFLVGKYLNIYARPVSLCALLILLLVNRRSAIIFNIAYALIMFMIDTLAFGEFGYDKSIYFSMLIGVTTGLLAIYLVSNVASRIKVFLMGFLISVPITICVICFEFTLSKDLLFLVAYGVTSGMLSVVLMMAILPFFEYIFNVVTDYRLSEITDHSSKLIEKLMEEAPGTFNHSLTVSTLAESCAIAIGENPLLARAAAYYHDIGKLKQPDYFTENQSGYNPHNELAPELSTDIIKAHARDGYDLIRKYHLPQILADVAREHHGTLPIKYFYAKALKFTEGELNIADFSYNGPRPTTKIAAIIMICDGSEAAVRALNDRSQDKVDSVVKNIIEERMDLQQFIDCPITMKDLDIIRTTIAQSLGGVYHDRIKYPKVKLGRK